MTNILLTLNAILLVLIFSVLTYAVIKIWRVYQGFRSFITAPDDKTPSAFAQTVEASGEIIARALVAQAKATFMGKQSGQARGEQSLQGAFIQDQASQLGGPAGLLAGVLTSFPAVRKVLIKNPGLIDLALGMINKKGGAAAAAPPVSLRNNGHQETETPQFSMKL